MAEWDRMLASIGLGTATLSLTLDAEKYPRGGTVAGIVNLAGGRVDQKFESLYVQLVESYKQGKSAVNKIRGNQVLDTYFQTYPGLNRTLPFEFQLPDDARLTANTTSLANTWRVEVFADILWAVNPYTAAYLTVVPHHEVTAVQDGLEILGFSLTSVYVDFAVRESPDTIVKYYRAPADLREQLDGASLHLRAVKDYVIGRFILNRHQHSVGEHLLALVGADREEHGFTIPRAALLTTDGQPFAFGAVPHLRTILSRALVLRENRDERTLLRPTNAPADDNSLLRPASSANTAPDSTLLHPLTDPEPEDPTR